MHVFRVVIYSCCCWQRWRAPSFSHTPFWTQTPPAFQVNHFSPVLVGWTQMETVKYYQAMLTFHLSCNRSLHARYNHHLLYLFFSLSFSLCRCLSAAWIQTHLKSPISSLSSLSVVLLWNDICCMLNFHHMNTYPTSKASKRVSDAIKAFWFPKEPFRKQFSKYLFFFLSEKNKNILWRTFCTLKGSAIKNLYF